MVTGHEIHRWLGLKATDVCCGVYVGTHEIAELHAPTKVGRSKNAQAIQRGRAQGGANWWFHAYFALPSNADTYLVESMWKQTHDIHRIVDTEQRQRELYHYSVDEAVDALQDVIEEMGYEVRCLVQEIEEQIDG